MNQKILAIVMALIMAAAALALSIPAKSDGTEGDLDDPMYLVGNADGPALIYEKDKNGNVNPPKSFKIDFNQAAYSIKDGVTLSITDMDGKNPVPVTLGTQFNYGNVTLKFTKEAEDGIYTADIGYLSPGITKMLIKVSFTTYFVDKDLDLDYFYGVHVRSVAGNQDDGNVGNDKITVEGDNVIYKGDQIDYLKVLKGTVPVFILKAYDPTAGDDKKAIMNTYQFYASNLPAGLAVKVDKTDDHEFVITGKAEHSIPMGPDGYALYKVVINAADANGNMLTPLEVDLRLYISEVDFSFDVTTVGDDGKERTETLYEDTNKVIKAGTSISVKPRNADGSLNDNVYVFYTGSDGKQVPLDLVDGQYVYPSKETDSGVVEIIMQNTVGGTTVQHKVTTLIVGNVVHSGLDPVVTSS